MKHSSKLAAKSHSSNYDHTGNLSIQCSRIKYFFISIIFALCLALLAISLASNKWLESRPIRLLRIIGGVSGQSNASMTSSSSALTTIQNGRTSGGRLPFSSDEDDETARLLSESPGGNGEGSSKFQGRIQFGLFSGTKVLNYGFGDRISQILVAQSFFTSDNNKLQTARPHEIITFRYWVQTLTGVVLAMLFALVGCIFAIINLVIVPQGIATGQIGLITLNSIACICSLVSTTSWLYEYFTNLKWTVLTPEEIQNGWTSEDRSQLGLSFYFVVAAFILHLVNITIILAVHSKSWTGVCSDTEKNIERHSTSSPCEGVIMLY